MVLQDDTYLYYKWAKGDLSETLNLRSNQRQGDYARDTLHQELVKEKRSRESNLPWMTSVHDCGRTRNNEMSHKTGQADAFTHALLTVIKLNLH